MHKKVVAKIKGREIHSECSPSPAPDQTADTSTVSEQELGTYLGTMFYMVDSDRTGLVPVKSLVDYLRSNILDLPKLHQWKLDELSKMLDPDNVQRLVTMELWTQASQTWVNTILDQG